MKPDSDNLIRILGLQYDQIMETGSCDPTAAESEAVGRSGEKRIFRRMQLILSQCNKEGSAAHAAR